MAFCDSPPSVVQLLNAPAGDPALLELAQALAAQWTGLTAGFHRLMLAHGQLMLTLCVGPVPTLLRQQQFHADAILLHSLPPDELVASGPSWTFKALGQCCRRGTTISFMTEIDPATLAPRLRASGIQLKPSVPGIDQADAGRLDAVYDPPWELSRRQTVQNLAAPAQHCTIIGAGLAGASAAAALARRGWQVTVLDQADAPAQGASGLPVGLLVPHVSADDCTLSRLSRAGVRLMLQQARELLIQDQDWSPCGVFERQIDASPQLPVGWSAASYDWARPGETVADPGDGSRHAGILHHQAGWLKPAQLVEAWLRPPGITVHTGTRIHALHQHAGLWELRDALGHTVLATPRVILANAGGAKALLQQLPMQSSALADNLQRVPALHGMRGLLSWSTHQASPCVAFPALPVNGSGAIIANIPSAHGPAWYMGSSYQPDEQAERADRSNHIGNLDHLRQLLPALADQLAPQFQEGRLQAWKGTRCISTDRLPLVGPVDPAASLWLCAAMGSRGLSLAMLCAELLAAQWCGEPLPVEARLAQSLIALRARTRA